MSRTVAILGTGAVGQTLAAGFVKYGDRVEFGTQHPDKAIEWADPALAGTPVLSYAAAAGEADLVVLAVKGTAAEDVVRAAGLGLNGKTVLDTTNPIADAPPVNGVLGYFTDMNDSLLERLQRLAPEAHFVKAFNSVGHALMVNPDFGGVRPTMFICGSDAGARLDANAIIEQFGWDTEDLGGVEAARAIEPLCILWCLPGFLKSEWTHAFKLLKK